MVRVSVAGREGASGTEPEERLGRDHRHSESGMDKLSLQEATGENKHDKCGTAL